MCKMRQTYNTPRATATGSLFLVVAFWKPPAQCQLNVWDLIVASLASFLHKTFFVLDWLFLLPVAACWLLHHVAGWLAGWLAGCHTATPFEWLPSKSQPFGWAALLSNWNHPLQPFLPQSVCSLSTIISMCNFWYISLSLFIHRHRVVMPHHHQTNSQKNLTFLKSNYKFKRRDMPAIRALPAAKAEARTPNQLAATMSKTSAAVATSDTSEAATATQQLPTAISSECRTILSLFIVIAWNFLQESLMANCWWLWLIEDDDQYGRDVNGGQDCSDEVSMAREHQQKHQHRQEQHQPSAHQQHQKQQYKHEHSSSSSPMKSMRCTTTVAVPVPAEAPPAATSANTVATSGSPAATSSSGHQSQSLVGQPLMALLIGLLLLNMRLVSGEYFIK